MNENKLHNDKWQWLQTKAVTTAICAALMLVAPHSFGATQKSAAKAKKPASATMAFAPQVNVALNKSTIIKLPAAASRISVGNPDIADVILLGSKEVYLLGKKVGATNIILWNKNGKSTVIDVAVGMDFTALHGKLSQLLGGGKNIRVGIANDSLVLSGVVADSTKVDKAIILAEAYAGKKVVNMLQVREPQQVMLEVKVAEVSKKLIDRLGVDISGSWSHASFMSSFIASDASAKLSLFNKAQTKSISVGADRDNELVKILAEPNIMALSGQEGAFLAGGRIFIPVPQAGASGTTITLEEKEFGVGLKFTPTVMENGLINLRVTPEVSEVSSIGTAISGAADVVSSTLGVTTTTSAPRMLLPTITTRRASTTVQLYDGQSFAIGGLIRNNVTESMKALPGLGELPVLGALFRSSEFQKDKTELLFVITPRLVKPLPPNHMLPTDNFIEPDRKEFFLDGKVEGAPPLPPQPADRQKPVSEAPTPSQSSSTSGFQMK